MSADNLTDNETKNLIEDLRSKARHHLDAGAVTTGEWFLQKAQDLEAAMKRRENARVDEKNWNVAVKLAGAKRSKLLTPSGGLTGLKVHAARYTEEDAHRVAEECERQNPRKLTARAIQV
jgi:hypothetical protein